MRKIRLLPLFVFIFIATLQMVTIDSALATSCPDRDTILSLAHLYWERKIHIGTLKRIEIQEIGRNALYCPVRIMFYYDSNYVVDKGRIHELPYIFHIFQNDFGRWMIRDGR